MSKEPKPERIIIPLESELLKRIEEFRWRQRSPSRSEAIRELIRLGLDAATKRDERS